MSQILTNSQKVIPTKFINEEYSYKFRSLKDALRDILKNDLRGEQSLIRYQFIKDKPENVFPFFSNEMNLEKLTPPFLKFKVLKKSTPELQEGTSIDYSLNLKGLPLTWRSEITRLDKNKSFVDEQRKGPYKKWTHTHNFISLKSGTLIQDDIIYKVPFGFLGNILAGSFIKKDLSKIFDYRYKKIMEEFPVIKG